MNNITRNLLIATVVLLGSFLGGFYYGKGQNQVEIQEKVITKEGESKVEYKDRIVTVIKTVQPDGTVTETTKTEEKAGTKETKTQVSENDKDTKITPVLSRYSLGVVAAKRWDQNLLSTPDWGATAGLRVLGEVWVKATVVPAQKTALLGVEIQL